MNPYQFRWKSLGLPLLFHSLLIGFLFLQQKPVIAKIKQPVRVQTIQLRPKQAVKNPSIKPPSSAELSNDELPVEIEIAKEPFTADSVKNKPAQEEPFKEEAPKPEAAKAEPPKPEPIKSEPPKLDTSKGEPIKPEASKSEAVKAEADAIQAPKSELVKKKSAQKEPAKKAKVKTDQAADKAVEKKKTKALKDKPVNKNSVNKSSSSSKAAKDAPPKKKNSAPSTSSAMQEAASAALNILHSLKDSTETAVKGAIRAGNIESLKSESFNTQDRIALSEKNYQDDISTALQYSLVLPEQGDVILLLTLHSDGKVKTVKIKRAESAKNSHYVSEKVPHLRFPAFKELFKGEKDHTFTITLCNK